MRTNNIFCTLFNSNYLDKGLALYYSMENVMSNFCLYIFAFDDFCYNVLNKMNLKYATIINLEQFETEKMLQLKRERSIAEYCWTCTPASIEYVLEKYNEPICTYIDADIYFFASPEELLKEIDNDNCSVMITEHRFENTPIGRKLMERNGKYCVQFNSFKNDLNGRKLLSWWKDQCFEWCFFRHEDNRMGDQKYLDSWVEQFKGVHEMEHLGGGLASWNMMQYRFSKLENGIIYLIDKKTKKEFNAIFVHFQNIRYLPGNRVNIKAGAIDKRIKRYFYHTYLFHIEQIRKCLKINFGMNFNKSKSCSTNIIVAFIQKNFMQYKIKTLSDIINLDRLLDSKYIYDVKGYVDESII